ncbi:hypothetical protein BC835DRAFT_1308905 [Cytidiella melzeri]|nr:hypothetical protein BC835DRAFT_1308905 [Cytidiella melzeri]
MSSLSHLGLDANGSGDQDAILLQAIGTDLLRSFISVVVETWLVVLIIKASQILITKSSWSSRRLSTLAVVLIMYAMDVVLWIIDVRNIVVEIDFTLIRGLPLSSSGASGSLDERHANAENEILKLSIVEDVLYSFMTVLGDFIIVSRVFAFWTDGMRERLVLVLPCMIYVGSIGTLS